jgi:hypothetical protein
VAWCSENNVSALADASTDGKEPLPDIWIPSDSFAKALYYTILADLGQIETSYINMVANGALLKYVTSNFTGSSEWTSSGKHPWGHNMVADPASHRHHLQRTITRQTT